MGIHRPADCSPRFIADCLFHEFGFPSRDVYNVHYLGEGLSELVVSSSSIPALQAALAGSSVELFTKFDPTVPLTRSISAENACSHFKNRIASTIDRLKAGPRSHRMVRLTEFFEAYCNFGTSSPVVVPTASRRDQFKEALASMNCPDPAMETEQLSSDLVQGSEQ